MIKRSVTSVSYTHLDVYKRQEQKLIQTGTEALNLMKILTQPNMKVKTLLTFSMRVN